MSFELTIRLDPKAEVLWPFDWDSALGNMITGLLGSREQIAKGPRKLRRRELINCFITINTRSV